MLRVGSNISSYSKSTLIMEAENGGFFTSSTLLKTSLLTIAFTSIYIHKSEKRNHSFVLPPVHTDVVVVAEKPVVTPAPTRKKKTIYLTFDDGPNKGTQKVMDILAAENTAATLFLVGQHVYGSSEQQRIYQEIKQSHLFEIANHSYSHAFENKYRKFYDQPDSVVEDFMRCADSLQFKSSIVRTPGRNIWRTNEISSTDIASTIAAADSLKSKGFTAIGWDLEWHFTPDQRLVQSDSLLISQIDQLFAKNKTKTENNLVILAHDRSFSSAEDSSALHRLIISLKKRNEFNFETVSQYPNILPAKF